MTLLAFAEQLRSALAGDRVEERGRTHSQVVYRVLVGKQAFVVTCEEEAADRDEPAIT